jgi:CMP-N,N'-diacetyllegionaminic acid synthase
MGEKMNIVGIIPARGGSKRTPRKNIKPLAGKPLIAYSIEAALKSRYINRVVVSTEDTEIAEVARALGAEVVIRPPELALDTTKTAPVLIQVVNILEKQGYYPGIVALLQPTSPQRDEKIVDGALEILINSDKDSIFAGSKIGKTMAKWKKGYDGKLHALYDYHFRPRTQEPDLMEDMFQENGSFYAIKIEAFRKCKDFLGESVEFFETPRYVDIDSPEDFARAEQLILDARKENETNV